MLPILVTIGQGLAWLAATIGQLFLWGTGVGCGLWFSKIITNKIDYVRGALMIRKKQKSDPMYVPNHLQGVPA